MDESKRLELANTIMQILAKRNRDNPKLTDHELLHIVRNEGDNTMQLYTINDAVNYLREMGAVIVETYMGKVPPAFDYVKLSKKGMAKLYENSDWPKPARGPKPIYHCVKCDAIINPTDEKCPNGHDLSIVGKIIKLTLTEGLTLSDSVNLTSKFVINKIGDMLKSLELETKTPENQALIGELNEINSLIKNLTRDMREEFEKDREPVPFSREKGIVIFILGVIGGKIIEWILFS